MAERGIRQGMPATASVAVEADAVCERCGNVNPEDTLLCKHCGNNLREQRARRLSESRMIEQAEVAAPPTRWLTGLLSLLGLLLIVWTGINVGRIENWLTARQTTDAATETGGYFSGRGSEPFDEMMATLTSDPLSQSEINRALAQPANPERIAGRYVIMRQVFGRSRKTGEAVARVEGEEVLVAALLENDVELRARGRIGKDGLLHAAQVGLRQGDQYGVGNGYVQRLEGNGYSCYGVTPASDAAYEAVAYVVPEPPQEPGR